MTRDPTTAEDCTQDAFIQAWRALPTFQQRSHFSTWLHRIAVNAVLARGRRRQEDLGGDESIEDQIASSIADTGVEDAGESRDLENAIGLPAARRTPCARARGGLRLFARGDGQHARYRGRNLQGAAAPRAPAVVDTARSRGGPRMTTSTGNRRARSAACRRCRRRSHRHATCGPRSQSRARAAGRHRRVGLALAGGGGGGARDRLFGRDECLAATSKRTLWRRSHRRPRRT